MIEEDEIVRLPKGEALSVIVVYPDEPGKEFEIFLYRHEIHGFQKFSDGKIVRIQKIDSGKELWRDGKKA